MPAQLQSNTTLGAEGATYSWLYQQIFNLLGWAPCPLSNMACKQMRGVTGAGGLCVSSAQVDWAGHHIQLLLMMSICSRSCQLCKVCAWCSSWYCQVFQFAG
jgi:hypothetical protein